MSDRLTKLLTVGIRTDTCTFFKKPHKDGIGVRLLVRAVKESNRFRIQNSDAGMKQEKSGVVEGRCGNDMVELLARDT